MRERLDRISSRIGKVGEEVPSCNAMHGVLSSDLFDRMCFSYTNLGYNQHTQPRSVGDAQGDY